MMRQRREAPINHRGEKQEIEIKVAEMLGIPFITTPSENTQKAQKRTYVNFTASLERRANVQQTSIRSALLATKNMRV